eukprot:gene2030-2799_t
MGHSLLVRTFTRSLIHSLARSLTHPHWIEFTGSESRPQCRLRLSIILPQGDGNDPRARSISTCNLGAAHWQHALHACGWNIAVSLHACGWNIAVALHACGLSSRALRCPEDGLDDDNPYDDGWGPPDTPRAGEHEELRAISLKVFATLIECEKGKHFPGDSERCIACPVLVTVYKSESLSIVTPYVFTTLHVLRSVTGRADSCIYVAQNAAAAVAAAEQQRLSPLSPAGDRVPTETPLAIHWQA